MNLNESFDSMHDELSWHINAKSNDDFVCKLTKKLEKRLDEHEKCERKTRKERHAIFSQCFEEIIRHNSCFGPLLSEIKVEYENCIGAVLRGERDADFLHRNLTSSISGVGTIDNYKQQIKDLEIKFRKLLEQNARLRNKPLHFEKQPVKKRAEQLNLNELHRSIAAIRGRSSQKSTLTKNGPGLGKFRVKVLERYTSSEQTNVNFLKEELQRLRIEVQELVDFFDKRFKLRKSKDKLIDKLMQKEKTKNDLKEQGNMLKAKLLRLEERLKNERKHRHLVKLKKTSKLVELILSALKQGETEDDFMDKIEDQLAMSESSDEDNVGEQEHEEMVEYLDKFERLFTQGRYEEAANVAATSPQDILRTTQTFERFKEQKAQPGEKSPLLYYCEAVMTNNGNFGQKKLSASESVDAVVRTFEENRHELVIQWLSQDQLKYSDLLGDSIAAYCNCGQTCVCGCYTLAEVVYRHAKAHGKVVSCLCRQGRLHMAMLHARNVAKFRRADFMRILEEFPSFTHANVLLLVADGYLSSPLRLEECITSLVRACRPRDAVRLLLSAHDRISCARIIPYIRTEHKAAWDEFFQVLVDQGFVTAAWDVLSAWVLADAFSTAIFKMGL